MTACLRFFCMGIKQTIKSLSCTQVHPTLVVTPWQGIISTLEITSRLHANLHSPCYWSDRRYKSLIWKVLKLMCNTNPSGEIRGPICPQGCKLTYGTTHFLYNLPTLRSSSKYTICTSSTNFLASAIPILNGDTLWLVAHCMTMPTREEWGRGFTSSTITGYNVLEMVSMKGARPTKLPSHTSIQRILLALHIPKHVDSSDKHTHLLVAFTPVTLAEEQRWA